MTKQKQSAPTDLSTSCPHPEGGGPTPFIKTTVEPQAGKKPEWRCGAPRGNQNAKKPVHPLSTARAKVRDLQKRIRAALRDAERQSCQD